MLINRIRIIFILLMSGTTQHLVAQPSIRELVKVENAFDGVAAEINVRDMHVGRRDTIKGWQILHETTKASR